MAFNKSQARDLITRTLKHFDWDIPALRELIMLTMAQESGLGTYLRQLAGGPALGVCQMELATHNDIWQNYLKFKPDLCDKVKTFMSNASTVDKYFHELEFNLAYAIVMAAVLYFRRMKSWSGLPADPSNVEALAALWKKHYNTPSGAGTEAQAVTNFKKYC